MRQTIPVKVTKKINGTDRLMTKGERGCLVEKGGLVIYHCFGGAHSSVVAAGIHLGLLSENKLPEVAELMALPYFDRPVAADHGRLQFHGRDEKGNKIYSLGRRGRGEVFQSLNISFMDLMGISVRGLTIVNAISCVNTPMVIGGFLSRHWGLARLGRPLVVWGIRKAFVKFTRLVQEVMKGL